MPSDAPVNELPPESAITARVSASHRVYLADTDGGYSTAADLRQLVVFLGNGACDRIVAE